MSECTQCGSVRVPACACACAFVCGGEVERNQGAEQGDECAQREPQLLHLCVRVRHFRVSACTCGSVGVSACVCVCACVLVRALSCVGEGE